MSEAMDSATAEPLTPEEKDLVENGTFTDPELLAHPRDFYRAVRKGDPVFYDEKLGSWLVTRFEDIWEVQSDPITYSVHKGYHSMQARGYQEEFQAYLREHGGGYFPDAIMSDPPYHTHIRKLMEQAFTAHRVKNLEPRIAQIIHDTLAEATQKGTCDAVRDIAIPITIRVIVEQLGLDHGMEDQISRWSVAVTAQIGAMQNRDTMLENAKQICELQNYLIGKMKEREAQPSEDMLSDIVHAEINHKDGTTEKLTFEESVSLIRAMLIAGNDTTATSIGNLFYLLATKEGFEDELRAAAEDDRQLNRFVEELLRFEPPVRALSRMTTKEVTLNGTVIPEGAHMLLVYGSGNDDETAFPNPREFDTTRKNLGRHVAFGGGPHKCVGIALARMEVKLTAREIARQLKNIELTIPESDLRYVPTVATRTLESLPIRFDRAD